MTARAALTHIHDTLTAMAARPAMYGTTPETVLVAARALLDVRAALLGGDDSRASYEAAKSERGIPCAHHAMLPMDQIGAFLADVYERERQRLPDVTVVACDTSTGSNRSSSSSPVSGEALSRPPSAATQRPPSAQPASDSLKHTGRSTRTPALGEIAWPSTDRLLSLRVDFRDEQAAAEVTVEQAVAYLQAHGWTEATLPADSKWRVFKSAENDLLVARHRQWVDYGRRMCETINALAGLESRSPLAVWCEMVQGERR